MGRPRADLKRDTRQDILAAALDLFAERGFAGTSVRMIASSAGVRESALYHYFSDKEAVLGELVNGISAERQRNVMELIEETKDEDLRGALHKFANRMLGLMQAPTPRKFMRMMIFSGPNLPATEAVARLEREGFDVVSRFTDALKARGLVRPEVNSLSVVLAMFGALMMLFHSPFSPRRSALSGAKLRQFIDAHVEMLARGSEMTAKKGRRKRA